MFLHNSKDFKKKELIIDIDKYIKKKIIRKFGISIYDKEDNLIHHQLK